jgi:hypothetical protein
MRKTVFVGSKWLLNFGVTATFTKHLYWYDSQFHLTQDKEGPTGESQPYKCNVAVHSAPPYSHLKNSDA